MNWIIENREWIFSGVGVFIIGLVVSLIIRNKKGVEKIINKEASMAQNKEEVQILFIDDEKFKTVENLKNAGWINTKSIKDVTNLDCIDVKNADVIFVDINGVGEKLFPTDKGLGLAEALKRKYPRKFIVIYSAQEHGDRFHKALKIVDYSLSKNAEPYEFINIIENCMK